MQDVNLRHLEAAVRFAARTPGAGTCIQRSAALMLDLRNATLVFGVMRAATPEELEKLPNASPVPFIHAWVELDGAVYSPTKISDAGDLRPFTKADYYSANEIRQTWTLSAVAFGAIAKRFGLSAAFRHNRARARSGDVTDALLTAAGVKWKLSERHTILPA